MNIFLDNVDLNSRSGPNHFAQKLVKYMQRQGHTFTFAEKIDAQLSFIQKTNKIQNAKRTKHRISSKFWKRRSKT